MNRDDARRRKMAQQKKENQKINSYLDNLENRGMVIQFIRKHTSFLFENFFDSRMFLNLFEKIDPVIVSKKLKQFERNAIIIQVLYDFDFSDFIPETLAQDGGVKDAISEVFSDSPFLDELISYVEIIQGKMNRARKEAEALYSTALNTVDRDLRIDLLGRALEKAPWGSVISLRVLKTFILFSMGEQKGKTRSSLRKEVENRINLRQRL